MSIVTLAYNQIAPTTATASSAASGYPATNVLLGKVLKPWRSTSAALTENIIIDLGTSGSYPSATLAISATNLVNATIYADTSNPPTTVRGTITFAADANGRYKGSLNLPGSMRYIKIKPNSGTPSDGAAYWSIGTVDVFTNVQNLARDPIYGESSIDVNTPRVSVTLDNGQIVSDLTGPTFMTPTLAFSGGSGDDHEAVMRLARAGLCWLNVDAQGRQWRVRHYDAKVTRKLSAYNRESVSIALKEEV